MIDPPIPSPLAGSALFFQGLAELVIGIRVMTHLAHCNDGVFATEPNTFDVDRMSEVPNLLVGFNRPAVPIHMSQLESSRFPADRTNAECMIPALLNFQD